jgi:hypothetical protein
MVGYGDFKSNTFATGMGIGAGSVSDFYQEFGN